LEKGFILKNDITAIRDARKKNGIKNTETLKFMGTGGTNIFYSRNLSLLSLLQKQTNLIYAIPENILKNSQNEIIVNSANRTFFLTVEKTIDTTSQKKQLQKDLDYLKGFLQSVEKKLGNQKFVQNAKSEVIETERKKKADAEEKIKMIQESLAGL
jgi:valyl-tRNA synthetase